MRSYLLKLFAWHIVNSSSVLIIFLYNINNFKELHFGGYNGFKISNENIAYMEHTEILEIVYRRKSCIYLFKGLKENVTETLESEQIFAYAVTEYGQERGWE